MRLFAMMPIVVLTMSLTVAAQNTEVSVDIAEKQTAADPKGVDSKAADQVKPGKTGQVKPPLADKAIKSPKGADVKGVDTTPDKSVADKPVGAAPTVKPSGNKVALPVQAVDDDPVDAPANASSSAQPDGGISDRPLPTDEPRPSNIPKDRMPTLALKLSPAKAAVGEVVNWELSVKRRKEDTVHLSSGADFGSLELKSKSSSEAPIDDKWVKDTLKVELIGFEAGDIVIPSQVLTVVDMDGNIAEVETEEADVTISSLIANEPEPALKEDTGPGEVVMVEDYLLLYILAGLGAALLVALLTLLVRKLWAMRRPKSEPPPPPPRPAEEVAYEKLNALKWSTLLAEGDFKEFHVRLSEAIREYIGNRYGFDSLELSSEELIRELRKVNISKTEYELVLDFLGDTDLVKFAKVLPTASASEDLLKQSFGFVDRTTPKAQPNVEAQNGNGKGDK